jgi:hypothetical protein
MKDTCIRGHSLTGYNLIISTRNSGLIKRYCRQCKNYSNRLYKSHAQGDDMPTGQYKRRVGSSVGWEHLYGVMDELNTPVYSLELEGYTQMDMFEMCKKMESIGLLTRYGEDNKCQITVTLDPNIRLLDLRDIMEKEGIEFNEYIKTHPYVAVRMARKVLVDPPNDYPNVIPTKALSRSNPSSEASDITVTKNGKTTVVKVTPRIVL